MAEFHRVWCTPPALYDGPTRSLLRQWLHPQVLERDHAAFVVLLKNQVAVGKGILLIDKVDYLLPIDRNDDVIALRENVLIKPSVGRNQLVINLDKVVQASRPHWIFVGTIDLGFIALRKAWSPSGAEEHAGVAAITDFDIGLELAVLAFPFHPEQMTSLPVTNNTSVFDLPGIGVLVRFPPI
jgi:hypothetical protein